MKTKALILVSALLLCALSFVAFGQGKFSLKYEEANDTNMSITSMTRLNLGMQKEKPTEIKGVPKGISENTSYAVTSLGIIALDLGSKPPKAYVDANGNGDLSDEKAFEGVEEKGRFLFKEVALGKENAQGKFEISAWLRTGQPVYMTISPKGFLAGNIKLGETTYKAMFIDTTFDGKYNSVFIPPIQMGLGLGGKFDNMAFDFNGNGRIEPGFPVSEVFPLVKMLKVKNEYYSIAVAEDASSISVEQIKPEMGSVNIGSGDVEILLYSDTGQYQLKGSPKYDLPAGKYQLMSALLKMKDKGGIEWALNNTSSATKMQTFDLAAGKPFDLSIGPQLTVKPIVTKNGNDYAINVTVTGKGGETYASGATKNNTMEPAPKVTITDEKGKVLDTGDFKYG
jgi:hypothetical protein